MSALQTAATPGRTVTVGEKTCLFFSGFSYLGMHALPAFRELLKAGVDQFGTVFMSSRIGNLRLSLYEELEHALAVLFRQQAAAVYSSGYLAAQAAVHYGQTRGQLLHAPGAHPALCLYNTVLPDQTWEQWAQQAIEKVNSHPDHTFVLVADAVNPLTSTVHNFDWLLAIERKVTVIIDDSHGAGILGPEGEGIVHTLPLHGPLHYLITASLAKAYSVEGGMVAGHAADIAAMKKQPFFTASTAIQPAGAYAFLHSGALYASQRKQLLLNINYLHQLMAGSPLVHNPHHLPIFLLRPGAQDLEKQLLEHDIIISSFPYPHPGSAPVQRIILSALHEAFDLETAAKLLKN